MPPTPAQQKARRRLKISALVCLGLLLLSVISEFLSAYQTRQELASPLIPATLRQEISQQYLFHAVVNFIMLLIAVGIFLLKRYWWAILLVAITLVGNRYLFSW